MRSQTLILLPAHNERGRIGKVIRGICTANPGVDILVVDDGSSDGTGFEARAMDAMVVTHPFNLGYGSALLTGYLYARRKGYPRIVQMDGDGQHDPECVPDLLRALDDGADVAVGSRYRTGSPPPTSWARKWGSRLFAKIVTRWTGTEVTDPTSGFQAMTADAMAEIAHDGFPEDYPDADVLITLSRAGMKLVEVPVRMHPRIGGVSMHRGGRAAYYAYKMLLTLSLLPWRRRSPFRTAEAVPARVGS